MKYALLMLVFTYSEVIRAEWLCKEASSQAVGSTFYACGHAQNSTLAAAREESFKAAKREFEAFCRESDNCKDYAYIITPLRTDCEKEATGYSCYRGLEYNILPHKRNSISVNRSDLEKAIKEKERELNELKKDMAATQKLNDLKFKVANFKEVDKKETEVEYLKALNRDSKALSRNITIGFQISSIPFQEGSKPLGALVLGYEDRIWANIGFRTTVSFLFGNSDSKLEDRGLANTSSEKEYNSHQGTDINLGLPITFGDYSFIPNFGLINVDYKMHQYQYNEFGVGTKEIEKKLNYNSTYFGLGLRYGKQVFIEVEPRQYLRSHKFGIGGKVGISFEF